MNDIRFTYIPNEDIEKIVDASEHIQMQLESAHSILNEACDYFINEDERENLPDVASQIEKLLHAVDVFILDATGAAGNLAKKVQGMLGDSEPIIPTTDDGDEESEDVDISDDEFV